MDHTWILWEMAWGKSSTILSPKRDPCSVENGFMEGKNHLLFGADLTPQSSFENMTQCLGTSFIMPLPHKIFKNICNSHPN